MSMFAEISEKTSLLDLTINELSRVIWNDVNLEELTNPVLLNRFKLLGDGFLSYAIERISDSTGETIQFSTEQYHEYVLPSYLSAYESASDKNKAAVVSTSFFKYQHPIDVLEKYAAVLPLYYAEEQESLTPEFVEKYADRMDMHRFLLNLRKSGFQRLKTFLTYKDGHYDKYVQDINILKFCTKDELTELGREIPECYDYIVDEKRIMSCDPCKDGQRSYYVWLRKYRKVTGTDGYPTWNDILEAYKKYPKMNASDCVGWIYDHVLDERDIMDSPDKLSITEISAYEVIDVLGNSEENQKFAEEISGDL